MSTAGQHDEAPDGGAVELLAAGLGPPAPRGFNTPRAGAPPRWGPSTRFRWAAPPTGGGPPPCSGVGPPLRCLRPATYCAGQPPGWLYWPG